MNNLEQDIDAYCRHFKDKMKKGLSLKKEKNLYLELKNKYLEEPKFEEKIVKGFKIFSDYIYDEKSFINLFIKGHILDKDKFAENIISINKTKKDLSSLSYFCKVMSKDLQGKTIDYSSLSEGYYGLLKNSSLTDINDLIINRIKTYGVRKKDLIKLEKVFNKTSEMNEKELDSALSKISDKIIGAVSSGNSQKIFNVNINEKSVIKEEEGKKNNSNPVVSDKNKNIDIDLSNKIIKDEIMDWDYFSTYFDKSFCYWQIKEALGWIAGYIETEDYNPNKVLVFNGEELNKKQTLKNILNDINKKSLTSSQPFITKITDENKLKEDFNFKFRPAGSGEVDVMLWSEKKQKSIALSVSRHRATEVEGNQFIRHYMKMLATTLKIKEKYKKEDINRVEARNYIKTSDFKDKDKVERFVPLSENIKKEISGRVTTHSGEYYHVRNDFLKDLSYVRNYIKENGGLDYLSNMKITKKEMTDLLDLGKKNLDYSYFGEVLKTDGFMMNLTSSLNSFAYTSNFKKVSNIEIGLDNAVEFLRNINFRYNSVEEDSSYEKGLYMAATIVIMKPKDFKLIAEGFSEGKVFSAERDNLFNSIGTFLKLIKEAPDVDTYLTDKLGLDTTMVEKIKTELSSRYFVSDLNDKFEQIKSSQSELEINKETTLLLAENINQKILIETLLSAKKNENNQSLEMKKNGNKLKNNFY